MHKQVIYLIGFLLPILNSSWAMHCPQPSRVIYTVKWVRTFTITELGMSTPLSFSCALDGVQRVGYCNVEVRLGTQDGKFWETRVGGTIHKTENPVVLLQTWEEKGGSRDPPRTLLINVLRSDMSRNTSFETKVSPSS